MLSFAAAAASAAANPTATGPVPFVAYLPHNAAHDDAAIHTAHERNKFLNRTARNDSDITVATDAANERAQLCDIIDTQHRTMVDMSALIEELFEYKKSSSETIAAMQAGRRAAAR